MQSTLFMREYKNRYAQYRASLFYYYIFCFFLPVFILCLTLSVIICGSEFELLQDRKGDTPFGPSILYWTETGGGIKCISVDGNGEKILISLASPRAPLDIALYMPGKKLYWAEYSGTEFQIRRAGIDGIGEELFYEYSDHGPTAIAIDSGSGIIYWNQYQYISNHNDIWLSALDNFFAVKWENTITNPYTYSICLDTINKKIYFTANSYWDINATFGAGNTGNAYLADLDIANTYSSPFTGTGPLANSVPFRGIAVDGSKGCTYYVSNSDITGVNIIRADLSLQNPVVWIASQGFEIKKLALDLKERKIYWTSDNDDSIYRADLDKQNSGIEKFLQLTNKPTGIAIAQ